MIKYPRANIEIADYYNPKRGERILFCNQHKLKISKTAISLILYDAERVT